MRETSKFNYILIDGLGVFLRFFYAYKAPYLHKKATRKTHAIWSFLRLIQFLKKKYNPEQIIGVFEKGAKLHKAYDKTYKKDRAKVFSAMRPIQEQYGFLPQIERIKQYLKYLWRCLYFISEGDEADAIIAEFVHYFIRNYPNKTMLIVSFDNDFWQLLKFPQVSIKLKDKIISYYNYDKYINIFKYVPPGSYSLYKAIKGDKTDNVIGVKGVGDKFLQKLWYNAWCEKRQLISPTDLKAYLETSVFLPYKQRCLLLQNLHIVQHNLPLVSLLDDRLVSLSGRLSVKDFIQKYILSPYPKPPNYKEILSQMLTDDGITLSLKE